MPFWSIVCIIHTVKFRKLALGLIFSKGPFLGAYNRRGWSTEGNLRFQIDWAIRKVGSRFTVFVSFYFVLGGNFPSTSSQAEGGGVRGAYIWYCDLTERMFCVTALGAYIWRGLYLEGLIFEYGNHTNTYRGGKTQNDNKTFKTISLLL